MYKQIALFGTIFGTLSLIAMEQEQKLSFSREDLQFIQNNSTETLAQAFFKPKIKEVVEFLDTHLKKALEAALQEKSWREIQVFCDAAQEALDILQDFVHKFDWCSEEFSEVCHEIKKLLKIDEKKSYRDRIEHLIIALEMKNWLLGLCDQSYEKCSYFYYKNKIQQLMYDHNDTIERLKKEKLKWWEYTYPEYVFPIISFGLIQMKSEDIENYNKSIEQKKLISIQKNNENALKELKQNLAEENKSFQWEQRVIRPAFLGNLFGDKKLIYFCSPFINLSTTYKKKSLGDYFDDYNTKKIIAAFMGSGASFAKNGATSIKKSFENAEQIVSLYDPMIDGAVASLFIGLNVADLLVRIKDTIGNSATNALLDSCLATILQSDTLKTDIISTASLFNKGPIVEKVLNVLDGIRSKLEQNGLALSEAASLTGALSQDSLGVVLRVFLIMVRNQPDKMKKYIGDALHATLSKLIASSQSMKKMASGVEKTLNTSTWQNFSASITATDGIELLNYIASTNKEVVKKDIPGSMTITMLTQSELKDFLDYAERVHRYERLIHDYKQRYELYEQQYKEEHNNSLALCHEDSIYSSLKASCFALQEQINEAINFDQIKALQAKIEPLQKRMQAIEKEVNKESVDLYKKYSDTKNKYEDQKKLYFLMQQKQKK